MSDKHSLRSSGRRPLDIAVLDSNREYIERLADAVRRTEGLDSYFFKFFSTWETLASYVKAGVSSPILLLDASIRLEPELLDCFAVVLLLSENPELADERAETYPAIFKYQPVTTLISIIDRHGRERSAERTYGNRRMSIWTVVSTTGGSGKTAFALHLAQELAHRNRSAFYWPADWSSGVGGVFPTGSAEGWANTFYYVKSKPAVLPSHWMEPMARDPLTRIYYKNSTMSWRDWQELESSELIDWMKLMRETSLFDDIVCDAGGNLDAKTCAILQNSDHIVWPLLDHSQSLSKARHAYEELVSWGINASKITFVLNQSIGNVSDEVRKFQLPIEQHFPYITDWRMARKPEQWYQSSIFGEQMKTFVDRCDTAMELKL
jgi:cellulose biosynthesis protein BcsQ